MASRRWSATAVLLAVLVASAPALLHAQAQQRAVYASAVDKDGTPVDGLGPSDFVVREDKVAREILNVVPASDPMQIALLVDNSTAAERYVRDFRQGLTQFINTIGADPTGAKHQVAIITFGERPTINTEFTTDLERAVAGANRFFYSPNSGAYLHDAIIETSQGFRKRESPHPVFVVLMTSGPELSGRSYAHVLESLRTTGAAFHVIVVGSAITGDQDRLIVLDTGTRDGGGRYDLVLTPSGVAPRMKELALELTHQYKITYARPQTLIPPDRVTVESAREDLKVRGVPVKDTGDRGGR